MDRVTGQGASLGTNSEEEARQIADAKMTQKRVPSSTPVCGKPSAPFQFPAFPCASSQLLETTVVAAGMKADGVSDLVW